MMAVRRQAHLLAVHQQPSTPDSGRHFTSVLRTELSKLLDTKLFCSISDCMRHDPAGIWAHLQLVLRHIRAADANITTVHFVSDGPTTQYRNKSNFYLASVIPRKLGYESVTWNFLEASHGKGAADGIGGAVKRQADRFVAEGNDIPDAASMYRVILQRTKVQLYLIEEEEFIAFDAQIPPNLCSVYGTMQIHQVSCRMICRLHNGSRTHSAVHCVIWLDCFAQIELRVEIANLGLE